MFARSFVPVRLFATTFHPSKEIPSLLRNISNIEEILGDKPPSIKNSKKHVTHTTKHRNSHQTIDGVCLMKHFRTKSNLPIVWKLSRGDEAVVNRLFKESKVKQEWSALKYEDIPGESQRLSREQEMGKVEDMENDEIEDTEVKLPSQTVKSLPEIVLMGRCNVGKSSLINAILTGNKENLKTYAKVKRKAGYTVCLNFYNVGDMFRLVDSPGYGRKGKSWQGELVFQYLQNRRVLRNCYLLLDSKTGLNQYDELIVKNLVQLGVPFDVVFNKIDKVEEKDRIRHMEKLIDHSVLSTLKIKPRYYFVNSIEGKGALNYRSGIDELRLAFLNSCGFSTKNGKLRAANRKRPSDEGKPRKKVKMIVHNDEP